MAARRKQKLILTACHMAFEGKSTRDIAQQLHVSTTTISRWRKLDLWTEFEHELIAAQKQHALQVSFM